MCLNLVWKELGVGKGGAIRASTGEPRGCREGGAKGCVGVLSRLLSLNERTQEMSGCSLLDFRLLISSSRRISAFLHSQRVSQLTSDQLLESGSGGCSVATRAV